MRKPSPILTIGILLALFFAVSLFIRVSLPYDQIFSGDVIKFNGTDAYYHMRLVDNMAHNFPTLTQFDPFYIYPGGIATGGIHLFDGLLAGITWIVGLGSPTQHTADVVGVYFPAVLAALLVIPVFFIGRALFNKWAGVLAAALIAVLPGEFLGRSILGATDGPAAEALFLTTTFLFFILAIKSGGERQLSFSHLIKRNWAIIRRPLIYSLLAGIFLGIYLNTWSGALLAAFVISLYFIIQFVINHLRRQSSDHLAIIGFITFFIAVIMFIPTEAQFFILAALLIGLFIPPVLSGVSRLMSAKNLKPAYYPLALVVLGMAGLGLFYLINPGLLTALLRQFGVFTPGGAGAATTTEMQPFLSPQGSFTTSVAWGNYTTSIYIAPCVLLFLIGYKAIFRRQSSSEENLFLLWTLLMLVLTLIQRRFAYYLVVNIALLSAYFSWQAIWLAGFKKWAARLEPPEESVQKEKAKTDKHKKHVKRQGISIYHINAVLAVIVVFFFVFFPNIAKATEAQGAATAHFAPSDGWEQALYWMRDNTPEPFGDPDAYYMLYEKPPLGEDFKYPETAYGVTSWWDYGYWITRIAHRLPSTNPSQASIPIIKVANLFLSQDESSANKLMAELDSSYLMLDHDVAIDRLVYNVSTGLVKEEGKFNALCVWAEQNSSDFHEIYFVRYDESTYGPRIFYYPEYYNSTIVRLYNFNGEAVTDVHPLVIEYEELVYTDGETYKIIKDVKEFSSYQEALDYVESAGPENHRLVGVSPFISPIPLASMEAYKLVYSSVYSRQYSDNTTISEVKIFKFFGD